jgi:hypothetical protein
MRIAPVLVTRQSICAVPASLNWMIGVSEPFSQAAGM